MAKLELEGSPPNFQLLWKDLHEEMGVCSEKQLICTIFHCGVTRYIFIACKQQNDHCILNLEKHHFSALLCGCLDMGWSSGCLIGCGVHGRRMRDSSRDVCKGDELF